MTIDAFFSFVRERYCIRLKRNAGEPKPWTDDPVLLKNSFTEVFREDDRTTTWLREYVRYPLRDDPRVLPAVLIFRWFNRIATGESIFCQPDLNGQTAFDRFMDSRDTRDLKTDIVALAPNGPWVTGAYTIPTKKSNGTVNKLDGVLELIKIWFITHDWRAPDTSSLENFCKWCGSEFLGPFMTDQVATDLRWTYLLEKAPDIMTWANPGPGCTRGLNRVFSRPIGQKVPVEQRIWEMRALLIFSREHEFWPREWPHWELHEVENCLCEFDKWSRGYSRRKYNGVS